MKPREKIAKQLKSKKTNLRNNQNMDKLSIDKKEV